MTTLLDRLLHWLYDLLVEDERNERTAVVAQAIRPYAPRTRAPVLPDAGKMQNGTVIVSVRFTAEQSLLVQLAAEREGTTTSEIIRRRVFPSAPPLWQGGKYGWQGGKRRG